MNHQPFEDWLFEQEDLTEQQSVELLEHLQACETCRSLGSALNEMETSLRAQPVLAPEVGFSERWQRRLEAERQRAHRKQTLSMLFLCAGGAVILLATLLVLVWPWLRSPEALAWVGLYRMLVVYSYIQGVGKTFGDMFLSLAGATSLVVWIFAFGLFSELSMLWVVSYRLLTNPRRITK
jgi:predicted anti-sigma-YlaC factor YlaD